MEVTLRLTNKQAAVMVSALDLYSRVLSGQVENVEEVLRWKYAFSSGKLDRARSMLNSVKDVLWGFSPGASHGIHNPEVHDDARKAFDLLQVLRNGVALAKNPEGGVQLCYDLPSQTSTVEPLATVQIRTEVRV